VKPDPFALRPWEPKGWRWVEHSSTRIHLQLEEVPLILEAVGPGVLRLRLGSPGGKDYGILQDLTPHPLKGEAGEGWLRAVFGEGELRLEANPLRLRLFWRGREVLTSSTDGHIRGGLRLPFLAREEGAWSLALALESGEAVYGLGEKFSSLNRRGGLYTSWNEDALGVNTERSYKNVPFLWSPRGWGLFVHTTARTHHGVGYPPWSHRSYVLLAEDEGLDLFFLLGSPAEILKAYADLTGHAPPVPRWSLGVWWSRCYYSTAEEALAVAQRLRAEAFPGDVLLLDGRAWLEVETRCTLDWDPRRYPDPQAFVAALKGLGFRLCLWEYPYVSVHSPLFHELATRGFFLRDREGRPYVYHWDPEPFGRLLTPLPPSGILDFTQEGVVRWWQERHRSLFSIGVDVMKTDFGEQVPEEAVAANGDTGKHLHNAYALLYNRAVYEATPERLVLARSGFAGSHRYPLHWGGDPQADWEGLAASIRGGLSWGMSGGAYYAHDVGGFYGTPEPQLYLRWAQAAVFFSHIRFHGTSPREPWYFGEEVARAVRTFLRLRMRLIPYLEKTMGESLPLGLPLVRPLPLAFPEDPYAGGFADGEFLLGPDLLVAPVLRPGGEVQVYVPRGRWYDLWEGRAHEGPDLLSFQAAPERIPLLAREGAVIPWGSYASRAEEVVLEGFLVVGEGIPSLGKRELGRVSSGFHLGELL
jgi:alpha-D-xyloside xylohydrolase